MNEKRPLDFRAQRIVKGYGFPMPLAERLRAARRVPQAVVKVASYGHGVREARELMEYISRDGKLSLETEYGDQLSDTDGQKALVQEWAADFSKWKKGRDTVHLVFSTPAGSDPEALRETTRLLLKRRFAGHQAVFVIHEDRKHPHAHVVLKMFNRETGKKLRLNRPELHRLREIYAEAAREQGIEMAVSSRAARGNGRKGARRAVYHLRQKGVLPIAEKETARRVLRDLETGRLQELPWERAMSERHQLERQTYLNEGARLRSEAHGQVHIKNKEALLKAAEDLERFGKTMPTPKTFRQSLLEDIGRLPTSKPKGHAPDRSSELDR